MAHVHALKRARLAIALIAVLVAGSVLWTGCAKQEEPPPLPKPAKGPETTLNDQKSPAPGAPEQKPNDLIVKAKQAMERIPSSALKPVPKGQDRFGPSAMKAMDLAKRIEEHMAALTGVKGEASSHLEFGGGKGGNIAEFAIKSGKRFKADYVKFIANPNEPSITRETVFVNGTQMATMKGDGSWSPKQPIGSYLSKPAALDSWPTQFPKEIFAAVAGGHPFTKLVDEATRAGMLVTTEDRYVPRAGRTILQRRILINQNPQVAAKKGKLDIEILADGTLYLPVTITASQEPIGGNPTRIRWSARWIKMLPAQQLSDSLFEIHAASGPPRKKAATSRA